MAFQMKYPINTQFIKPKTDRRPGTPAKKIRFLVAHDTGNVNSTAQNNVDYYCRTYNEISASAHIFTDAKQILECIPALTTDKPEKAWHVRYTVSKDNELYGVDSNDSAIGFELCFCKDGRFDNEEAFRKWIWSMAYACYKYGLNPLTDIISHEILDPSRKVDPGSALVTMGKLSSRKDVWATINFVRRAVKEEYDACLCKETPAQTAAVTPTASSPDGIGIVYIEGTNVSLRTGPGASYDRVRYMNNGENYKVYGELAGWLNLGGDQWVYYDPSYIRYEQNKPEGVGVITVIADVLNVRSGPGTEYEIVQKLRKGEAYKSYGIKDGWYSVGSGWVHGDYVTFKA